MPARRRPAAGKRNTGAAAVAVTGALLSLAACGGLPNPLPAGRHYTVPATGTSAPAAPGPVAPLTGLPAASARAAQRPAIAVALAGRHLTGLAAADVIFEDITTPQVRYLALYQSRPAASIGPVISTRPEDGMAASVLHPLMAYAGGRKGFVTVLQQAKVTDLGYARHHGLYHGSAGHRTTSTAALWGARQAAAPPSLFLYRGSSDSVGGPLPADAVRLSAVRVITPHHQAQWWVYDPRSARWTQVSGGPRVAVANLVIQTVRYKTVSLDHRTQLTAPSARPVGEGRATVLSGSPSGPAASGGDGSTGVEVRVDWSKPDIADVTNYLTPRGVLTEFQPGPTWVVLAPAGTRVVPAGQASR